MDTTDIADVLPVCTGVIVPGYDRGESLCPTSYTPNRHAVLFPHYNALSTTKHVRIVYSGDSSSPTQKTEIQVDGMNWVAAQEVDLKHDPSSGLISQIIYDVDNQQQNFRQFDPTAPAKVPVSLWSVKRVGWEEVAKRIDEKVRK